MKKLLFFAALAAVAIGSFGGNMIGRAHAQTAGTAGSQTLTPAETAALQQQLDVAKAELANLEMQAGRIPGGDAGSAPVTGQITVQTNLPGQTVTFTPAASAGLTASQVTALKGTLGTLAAMLTQLSSSITTDASLTTAQQTAVATTLGSMKNTLVAMAATVNGTNASGVATGNGDSAANAGGSAPVASAPAQSQGSAVAANVAPSTQNSAGGNTAPAANNNAAPVTTNPAPAQTAQASSIWSFTKDHWPTIVIVLLIVAILAILFWPEKKDAVRTVQSGSGKPKSAPIPSPSTAHLSQSNSGSPRPATPVSNAVAAPSAQK